MDKMPYKGYLINATPEQLAESGEWTILVCISRERGSDTYEKKYSAGNKFKTEEEAIPHCFEFGKQVIDGKIANCTVDDL